MFWKPHQISVQVSFAFIGRFILVYIHSRLSQQLLKAHAAIRKLEKAFLKGIRDTGRNFTISKWFHRSKQKLYFGFPSQKDKTISTHSESTVSRFRTLKKNYSSCDTLPFKLMIHGLIQERQNFAKNRGIINIFFKAFTGIVESWSSSSLLWLSRCQNKNKFFFAIFFLLIYLGYISVMWTSDVNMIFSQDRYWCSGIVPIVLVRSIVIRKNLSFAILSVTLKFSFPNPGII